MEEKQLLLIGGAAVLGYFFLTQKPKEAQEGSFSDGSAGSSPLDALKDFFSTTDTPNNSLKDLVEGVGKNNAAIDSPTKKEAVLAGSAGAASADINAQLYSALGIGDATSASGNLLKFNVPRDSSTAYAIERYTAANYPNSLYQTTGGDIVFSKKDISTLNLAQPAGNGLYTPVGGNSPDAATAKKLNEGKIEYSYSKDFKGTSEESSKNVGSSVTPAAGAISKKELMSKAK